MLKNLLVHIPSEREIRPIIDGAVSLAMTRAAHLDGVSIGFETTPMGFAMDGGAAIAATFEFERERALARANAALAVFETEVRNAGITYGLRPLAGIPAEAAATMGALARLYDLTIVLQPEFERVTFDNTIPQEILFQSGGPVLFVPFIHRGPLDPKHIGIAWNGSRLLARPARRRAFLTRAETITIVSVSGRSLPRGIRGEPGGPADAARHHRTNRARESRPRRNPADHPVDCSRHRPRSDRDGRLRAFQPE